MKRNTDFELIDEGALTRAAEILGTNSAAAKALACASAARAEGRSVQFMKSGGSIFVRQSTEPEMVPSSIAALTAPTAPSSLKIVAGHRRAQMAMELNGQAHFRDAASGEEVTLVRMGETSSQKRKRNTPR